MYIEDSPAEGIEKGSAQQAHEASEADQFGTGLMKGLGGFLLRFFRKFRGQAPTVYEPRSKPRPGRPLQDVGVGDITEHQDDLGLKRAGCDGVEDGLHVGAGAGAENTEADHS